MVTKMKKWWSELVETLEIGGKKSEYTVRRCRVCGRIIHRYKGHKGFEEVMSDIRRHYKKYHPRKFREMIRKALQTKRERGIINKRR